MTNPIFKKMYLLLVGIFSIVVVAQAQKNGTLPETGIRYFNEGIVAKKVEAKIDGTILRSNRVELGKYVDIFLHNLSGITELNNKYFLGIDVLYISSDKKILSNTKNIFKDFETKGFTKKDLDDLKISVNLRPEIIKQYREVDVMIKIYDLKSKNQMRLIFAIQITEPGTAQSNKPAPVAKTATGNDRMQPAKEKAKTLKGLTMGSMEVSVDHSIRVAPTMAYLSIEMLSIKGTNMTEIVNGDSKFSVFDENNKAVKITDKLLHKVKGSMEGSLVDFTVKIPFRAKTVSGKKYKVVFTWTSSDKRKTIEVVTNR